MPVALAREIKAIAEVLADPANEDRTPEELAADLISALDEVRSNHNRLAVIGRFTWDGTEYHDVVLGPFSTRSVKAARDVGAGLTGATQHVGHGKFKLIPAFATARAAWEAFKPEDDAAKRRLERILGDVHRWAPGLWAHEAHTGPVCHCGARTTRPCPVHPR